MLMKPSKEERNSEGMEKKELDTNDINYTTIFVSVQPPEGRRFTTATAHGREQSQTNLTLKLIVP